MPIQQILKSSRVPVKIWTDDIDDIDERSKEQLANIASLPFVYHHVAAMPDVHLGIGATIGSVIATNKAIIPAAVGVDIGCGMVAARLCQTDNGETVEAIGVARQVGNSSSPKLKVRFASAILIFVPMVWGDYWVVDLDQKYQLAAVSDGKREYLWIGSWRARQRLIRQRTMRWWRD